MRFPRIRFRAPVASPALFLIAAGVVAAPACSIAAVTVQVLAPNGGEIFAAAGVYAVTWTASAPGGVTGVDLFASYDGGATFQPIARNETNDGSFSWFVPNRPGAQTFVRAVARDGMGGQGADQSDAAFTITAQPGGVVATTLRDFDLPGTQPFGTGPIRDPAAAGSCKSCHGGYAQAVEPWRNWQGNMMAHAGRDPFFYACLAVAEQDVPSSGDACIRCHTPGGWLEGRSVDTGGELLTARDRQGVHCDICHRSVDPFYQPGVSPPQDQAILAALGALPAAYGNGQFVVDPDSTQRGPRNDALSPHSFIRSPFHRSAAMCGTCHDVSNPAYVRGAGPHEYVLQATDAPHPDGNPRNMFPIERTYSEWSRSTYAAGGVYAPQFAGNKPDGVVSTCQDCHMRDVTGKACAQAFAPTRTDLALHDMTGGNYFVPDILPDFYPGEVDTAALQAGKARALEMLAKAATLSLDSGLSGGAPVLDVTVTNQTGHKLPTGYPEGRRMWLHVRAFDEDSLVVYESGAYDAATGELTHDPALKMYQAELGVSQRLAAATALAAGPSFHFAANDTVYGDNRIPPRGFTNAAFDSVQAAPVGYAFADSQYWDATSYSLPVTARWAIVCLLYQSTSREYVEFLRDVNATNGAGQDLYDAWAAHGRAAPAVVASDTLTLDLPTGVAQGEGAGGMGRTALLPATPSPARTGTTVRVAFRLAEAGETALRVFDVEGRLVRSLAEGWSEGGRHEIAWDGRDAGGRTAPPGIYFVRFESRTFAATRKLVLVK